MDIKLPQLAEGVESGTVVSILVSEGSEVKKDQPIMELETQKAVGSIPSPEEGIVTKIHVKEGMEVSVGQVLITVSTEAKPAAEKGDGAGAAAAQRQPNGVQPAEKAPAAKTEPADFRYESKTGAPPPASPSIRKLARDLDIDLTRVRGSEAGGRIVLRDLRAYIRRLQELARERPAARPGEPGPQPRGERIDFARWGPIRREKLSPLRRTVGRRMVESWSLIPKINQFDEADITDLLALRKQAAPLFEKKGAHLTITAFILRVLGRALRKHPRANASLDEEASEIVYKDYCHIGVAVDTDAGLIVPVLRDADKKSVFELSKELHELTERTRMRKVSVEELQGGTFTISNQGSIGGGHFTPIIYYPQVAILGVGQGRQQPRVVNGKIVTRSVLPLCLAYDHRVLDGADAVRFLKDVIAELEAFPEAELKAQ